VGPCWRRPVFVRGGQGHRPQIRRDDTGKHLSIWSGRLGIAGPDPARATSPCRRPIDKVDAGRSPRHPPRSVLYEKGATSSDADQATAIVFGNGRAGIATPLREVRMSEIPASPVATVTLKTS
jgi:hypothetical protein